jgi:cytochrome c oxidase assembly factor CtaG
VHALVHIHLVVSGVLFGVAILGLDLTPWRRRHAIRLFAAALALPVHTILGLVVLSAAHPYLNPGMAPGDGLADQRFGAALLWLTGDGLATVVILVIVAQWFEAERRASPLTAREPGATPSRRGAPSVPNRPAAGSAPRG